MNCYYYLLSSLPTLNLYNNKPLNFTKGEFLENIKIFVPARDFQKLSDLFNDKFVNVKAVEQYCKIKNDIDGLILQKREFNLYGKNLKYKDKYDFDSQIVTLVDEVINDENPQNAEMKLLNIYWLILDKISLFQNFNFTAMCIYVLKLKILMRVSSFDRQRGMNEFEKIYSSLRIDYKS